MSTTATTTDTKTFLEGKSQTFGERYETKDLITFDENAVYGDWRDEFHENGCVVIKNVISREKAQYYADKQIQWLKKFELGFDEKDPSTWTAEQLPVSFKGGMYFLYGSAHEKMSWEARMEPAVRDIFAKLWGTNELICSFDGMNISMPKRTDVQWSPWPHCDQNPRRKGRSGSPELLPPTAKTTFFAEKRDSADHEDAPPPEIEFMDLFLFSKKDVKWFEDRGCELVKINMEPGDFVLWDSRTMHYAKFPEGDQIRNVQYICMTPRQFADEDALAAKKWCFENYVGTTHWPHCNVRSAAEKPMRNGELCPKYRTEPFEKPEVNDDMLRLAGIKPY
ncbi:hypothetical protein PG994_002661 [Apiospora phragmitis]|uniref:Phytanoyl-CoA dioxygenase n=1 Tax=Apiospora phragmitis TaxID=2905665 RepID=A0ABR1W5T7_9PEZI